MAAAVSSMVTSKANHITQQVDFKKQKAAGAYPLTMVIYAMVPTSGVKATKADAIARFLDYVAGPGQTPGLRPGNLPPGYLPLPSKLRAKTLRAATLVRNQKGNSLHPKSSPSPSTSPTTSQATSPAVSPSPSRTHLGAGVQTVALKSAQTSGLIRYALPVLLIVGGAATLGGASSLAFGSTAAVTERIRRLRRLRLVWRHRQ
jgi:hypothetical protein